MTTQTKHKRQSTAGSMSLRRWCEFAVLIFGCLAAAYISVSGSKTDAKTENDSIEFSPVLVETGNQDFSKFRHSDETHARMPCLLCHKRTDNSPVPKLPGHMPCAGCHVQQFADNQNPICAICHTNRETGGVKRFPALRSFNARFDHATHTRRTNCATCHKPSGRGVSFSAPSGSNAHAACFQCHAPQTQIGARNIGSCGTCHQPGRPNRAFYAPKATAIFNHSTHVRGMNCSSCHSIRAGAARGRQVVVPLTSMHFAPPRAQSCASCHNNKRAFGGDDYSDCKHCHRGSKFKFR